MPFIFPLEMDVVEYRFATGASTNDKGDEEHPILPPDQWFLEPAVKGFTTSSPTEKSTYKRFRIN
jgi:hypothetical protein